MELRHLRYFVVVAEELHFRRAAERLHMSQPPLSQQIRALEEEVGATLLLRTQRKVELTGAGAAFLQRAREILGAVEDAALEARRVQRGEVGRLAIGFVGSAMYSVVPERLRAFRDRHPDVGLRLHELGTTEQLRRLDDGRLDIGFIRAPGSRPGLSTETVLREPVVAAPPDGHPLARGGGGGRGGGRRRSGGGGARGRLWAGGSRRAGGSRSSLSRCARWPGRAWSTGR